MPLGRFFGRHLCACTAAVCATWLAIACQTVSGQERQPPARPSTSAKATDRPVSKTGIPTSTKATDAAPAAQAAATLAASSADSRLTFSFRYQPWQDVLDWFAQQAGLSLLMESPPPGTFNYSD